VSKSRCSLIATIQPAAPAALAGRAARICDTRAVSTPEGKQTAFNRSPRETGSVIALGLTAILPLLYFVAVAMIWRSKFWTTGDKLFSTLFPLLVAIASVIAVEAYDVTRWVLLAGSGAALFACFVLSFRMGMRDPAATRELQTPVS
jgi:hypothetical protein